MRVVNKAKYRSHSEPLFKNQNLIKLDDMYSLTAMKFYYKYVNNLLPLYFVGMFDTRIQTHSYNTRNRDNVIPNRPRHFLLNNSVRYTIPDLLKKLPSCIIDKTETHSIKGISTYMKKHVLNQYSETCSVTGCYTCANS